MVADGMGGHRGGDRASRLAIDSAQDEFIQQLKAGKETDFALSEAMNKAALQVFEAGHNDEASWGMGTTLSAVAFSNDHAFIAHIGDTRIYCLRNKTLTQLTNDHSLVNEQVQAGILSPDEARLSPLRNIITRALGQNKLVSADYSSLSIQENDKFLLCSDGLTTMVSEDKIAKIINDYTLDLSVAKLIEEANRNGGEDNITVILLVARA